ncbi:malto-oligosyltrehalose trehalohydrolase [Nocardioides bruguierae]|uniref:malto-oligosyltrehalose trehalohydrolase n=1 Tax=Nocardioides bruguierae TaxID=2945102 RepID=UPI002021B437|nr:malto-oligosyltrehalose trehalohydrolase [Nocardioides bruguierae]MCL8025447.1 malto-oligosyltrehalose trehalohydrolase [Nocardioides bruguierae]
MATPLTKPGRGPFDVWAPKPSSVSLRLGDGSTVPMTTVPMTRGSDGWWTPAEPVPADGPVDYGYLLDEDDTPRPDPRSAQQPAGVHGLSRWSADEPYAWGDAGWTGRQLGGSVIYELHVGTFTPGGTLDSAIERLDHLVELGVDLVEPLPVNAFGGTHNWGYDGVGWFAVTENYGGPDAYRRFVDACHARGLGVVQDVVYNHLGPSGNYLPMFGSYLKTGRNTWGDLLNLDEDGSAEVRRYILDNVRMWFAEYHVDALRLDAVHALRDSAHRHLLEEMAIETAALSTTLGRPLTLIAESDLNDPRLITPREAGGYGLDAQWSDDFHHAVHVALTGETTGYYADFEPLSALAKVCERGFFHDGTYSSFRGRDHGVPVDTAHMPTWRLVVCNQNHDQIGNRAIGDRLTEHLDEHQLGCAALLTLAGPFTPMLFQGEEWGATTPFQFFTSHTEPELGKATAEGRIAEFAEMGWDPAVVPDPQDPETFTHSKLDWAEPSSGHHARLLALYRLLGSLRRTEPALTDPGFGSVTAHADEAERLFTLDRTSSAGGAPVRLVLNLAPLPASVDVPDGAVVLARTGDPADSDVSVSGSTLSLAGHAGVLLRLP